MLEYRAPNGDLWRLEDTTLLVEFDLPSQDDPCCQDILTAWHARLAGLGQPWAVVQRYFGLWPVIGTAPAMARQWMPDEICTDLGINMVGIEDAISSAVHFWKLAKGSAAGLPTGDMESGARSQEPITIVSGGARQQEKGYNRSDALTRELPEAEIDRLLVSNDMDDITGDQERRLAASRLVDLDDLLADDASRPMVHMAIRQELDIRWLNARISEKRHKESEATQLRKLIGERDEAQKGYDNTMKSLGATQSQKASAHRRAEFQHCLGLLTQGMQEYYAKGDRTIIDGMNTEAEVVFEMEPVVERDDQYDPATALNAYFANLALFDPDYECPVPASGIKRLRQIWKRVKEEWEAEHEIEPRRLDDPVANFAGAEADEDDLAAQDATLSGNQEATLSAPAPPAAAPNPLRNLLPARRAGGDDLVACG